MSRSSRSGSDETLTVSEAQQGIRLDKLLSALRSVGSREKARQVLRSGKVEVDGVAVGPDEGGQALTAGNTVVIHWNRPGTGVRKVAARDAMAKAGVVVRFEDEHVLVADKPAGLLTDAADLDQARYQDTLRKRVQAFVGREVWPAHRIDRHTTGLVLFAKTERARDHLKAQWVERKPLREYRAWVEGRFPRDSGRFGDWMGWDSAARLQRPVPPHADGAWFAEADFEVTERFGDLATELRVRLVTGRRNQIRLHVMLAGHPLVGEALYRLPPSSHPRRPPRPPPVFFARQALHAARLGVVHPATDEPITWEAPLPVDLEDLLARLSGSLQQSDLNPSGELQKSDRLATRDRPRRRK
jgi:23S rRNA pseudouridine1911/1915/1917 synthase